MLTNKDKNEQTRKLFLEIEHLNSPEEITKVKNHIIELNMYLLDYIRQKNNYFERDDIKMFGAFGLMDAVNKFTVSREIAFSNYAWPRIMGSVIDHIRNECPITRNDMNILKKYNKFINEHEKNNDRKPTRKELVEEFTERVVRKIEELPKYVPLESRSLPGGEDGSNEYVLEIKNENINIEKKYIDNETNYENSINIFSNIKHKKDKFIFILIYCDDYTQADIASLMSVTESYICQRHMNIKSTIEIFNRNRYEN